MTQIPPAVSVAVPMNSRTPSLDYLYIHTYRFSNETYKIGTEGHLIDGVPVKIYSPEKTMVDCFKFRNKIGMGVPLKHYNSTKIEKVQPRRTAQQIRKELPGRKCDYRNHESKGCFLFLNLMLNGG